MSTEHKPVPVDVGIQILELKKEGIGRDWIGFITGINSSTVKRVISGEHQNYSNSLSARQVQGLINQCFRPIT